MGPVALPNMLGNRARQVNVDRRKPQRFQPFTAPTAEHLRPFTPCFAFDNPALHI